MEGNQSVVLDFVLSPRCGGRSGLGGWGEKAESEKENNERMEIMSVRKVNLLVVKV